MCLYKFGARDSWLNNWEHRGEDMYCPRALLKIPESGTTFFFPLRTPLLGGHLVTIGVRGTMHSNMPAKVPECAGGCVRQGHVQVPAKAPVKPGQIVQARVASKVPAKVPAKVWAKVPGRMLG